MCRCRSSKAAPNCTSERSSPSCGGGATPSSGWRFRSALRQNPRSSRRPTAWRLLDLSASNEQPIDLLIATRFPSYFARHPRKVAWVIHQHRTAYELCGTPYSDFEHTEADVGLRRHLLDLDRRMLGECRHVFTNAQNTATRLEKFNGVAARALYHPPPLADQLRPGDYGT